VFEAVSRVERRVNKMTMFVAVLDAEVKVNSREIGVLIENLLRLIYLEM
jgi:hypothetical protein